MGKKRSNKDNINSNSSQNKKIDLKIVKIFDDNLMKYLLANRLKPIEHKKYDDMGKPFKLLESRVPNLKHGETYVIFLKREQRRELGRQINMLSRISHMEEFNQFPAKLISDTSDMQRSQNSSTTSSDCLLKDLVPDSLKEVERSLKILGPLADESFSIYMDRLSYLLSLLFTTCRCFLRRLSGSPSRKIICGS